MYICIRESQASQSIIAYIWLEEFTNQLPRNILFPTQQRNKNLKASCSQLLVKRSMYPQYARDLSSLRKTNAASVRCKGLEKGEKLDQVHNY